MLRRAVVATLTTVCCLLFVSADQDEVRRWTDDSGSFSVDAALLDFNGQLVRLEKTSGDVVSVPIERLSRADQDFVRQQFRDSADPFAAPTAQWIEGKVVGVTDGDTLTVLDERNVQHKIRLDGIDAPEDGQDYGQKAKEALSSKVFSKDVRVRWREKDKYGRTVGAVFVGDRWINRELVAEGWAWRYDDYSRSKLLKQAQESAKEEKLGLWIDANEPVPPWIFRHPEKMKEWTAAHAEKRGPPASAGIAATPTPSAPPAPLVAPQESRSHWINSSSGVRHNRGCRYFANTKSGHYCGPNDGKACGICGG